ncbi:Uncharacterised protein [Streptococcus pneumoniae]|nr:Uncharacterised protein [Streptococcus pneumoniae]
MGNLSHRLLFKEELSDFLSHHVGNLAIFLDNGCLRNDHLKAILALKAALFEMQYRG